MDLLISHASLVPYIDGAFEPLRYFPVENLLYSILILLVDQLKIIHDARQLAESAAAYNVLLQFQVVSVHG